MTRGKKCGYIQIEFCSAIKKTELMPVERKWREKSMLSFKKGQIQKEKYVFAFIRRIQISFLKHGSRREIAWEKARTA